MTSRRRVLVIGLDCVPPALAFDRFAGAMPNLSRLMQQGVACPMTSVVPPITVPAWACMTTGKTPGELGIYGFRDRKDGAYGYDLVTSTSVRSQSIFDRAAALGLRTASLFVPPGHPPQARPNAVNLGCFLTPHADSAWSHPAQYKVQLQQKHGAYLMDAVQFRSGEHARLEEEIFAMTKQHFAMAEDVWRDHAPDLMWMVEIGPDRLHHAFWQAMHTPSSPFFSIGERYYAALDAHVGRMMDLAGDDTNIIVASDHGARTMKGAFAINEWLIAQGLLTVRAPDAPRPLQVGDVDWSRTQAWGEGGYVGRVFVNMRGREPNGIVPPEEVDALSRRIAQGLERVALEDGSTIESRVFFPQKTYQGRVHGRAPELIVAHGDLSHRAIGTIGSGRLLHAENDLGEDGCNHDWQGIFAMRAARDGRAEQASSLLHVHDIIARALGLPPVRA